MALADLVLVMNAGKVEQQGTPYQLFTKPKNRFVAQFGATTSLRKAANHFVREDRIKIVTGEKMKSQALNLGSGPPEGEVIFRPADSCSVRHGI